MNLSQRTEFCHLPLYFLKNRFQLKKLLKIVDLMHQLPESPYSYFSKALEFCLRVRFPFKYPSKYVNHIYDIWYKYNGKPEENAVYAMFFHRMNKTQFSKMDAKDSSIIVLVSENVCISLNCCLWLILNHLLQVTQNLQNLQATINDISVYWRI